MRNETINRVSGHVVLGLSVFAMLLVVGATVLAMLGKFNPSHDGHEGTAARLFQLAVVLLLPAGLVYLVTADRREPLKVAKRLIVPALALVVEVGNSCPSRSGASQSASSFCARRLPRASLAAAPNPTRTGDWRA